MPGRPGYRLLTLALVCILLAGACADEDEPAATSTTPPTTQPANTTLATTTTTAAPTTTSTPATTTTSTTVPALEPIEGVITVGLVGGTVTTNNYWAFMDPEASFQNGYLLGHSHPGLYRLSLPDFRHVPLLAVDAAPELVLEGGNWTATIPIRESFEWSDGEPVTAEDLVFSFAVGNEFELGGNWQTYRPVLQPDDPETEDVDEAIPWIAGVEALNDRTVKITFNGGPENPPGLVIYQNGILFHPFVPEHFWAPVVDDCRIADDPMTCLYEADGAGEPSAGTMIYDSWAPGIGASIVANPTYYYRGVTYTVYDNFVYTQTGGAHDLDETHYGEPGNTIVSQWTDGPFVEEVRFIEYDSPEAHLGAFLRGDIDVAFAVTFGGVEAEIRERLQAEPDIEMASNPNEAFRYLAFNLRKAPMDNPAFRRALALMIDKEFVTDEVLSSEAIPMYSLIPPQNTFWHTDDIERWGAGLPQGARFEAAVQMLADEGYTWATVPEALVDDNGGYTGEFVPGQGLRQPDGTPVPELELLTPTGDFDPLMSAFAVWIGEWAERLDVPIARRAADVPTIVEAIGFAGPPPGGLDWDMYMFYWAGGDPSLPCTAHQAFFDADQDAATGSGFNLPGYNDPEFETLSDAFEAATSIEAAQGICAAMERNISENLPYIVLFRTYIIDAWRTNLEFAVTEVLSGLSGFLNGLGQVKLRE